MKKDIKFYYNNFIEELFRDGLPDDIKLNTKKILESILNYMFKEDYSDSLSEFIRFTKYLDQHRDQNIIDIVPAYSKIFKE
jgi:hypothetical protein